MCQMLTRSTSDGSSQKNIHSIKPSARVNSGGTCEISLLVATTKTSVVWSESQVKSEPSIRDATPLSFLLPLPEPLNAFSSSSMNKIAGAIASTISSARRTLLSDCPTKPPIKRPISITRVGRPVSLPSAFAKAILPVPGTRSNSFTRPGKSRV